VNADAIELVAHARRVSAASALLQNRSLVLARQSRQIRLRAWQQTMQSAAMRANNMRRLPRAVGSEISWRLDGLLDGQPVWAQWERGRLRCHEGLRACAEAVVVVGDRWLDDATGEWIPATTTAPADAVLLTVLRACSAVRSVQVKLPRADVS
jgi:hypothetical protein